MRFTVSEYQHIGCMLTLLLTLYDHIETTEQQQYGDWYAGR